MGAKQQFRCQCPGCGTLLPAGRMFCGVHWAALPRDLKAMVRDRWRALRSVAGRPAALRAELINYRTAVRAAANFFREPVTT